MKTVKIFYYNKFEFDKKIIITEFQNLEKNSSLHVIFVTEALELNVNLSDIQHVILYELSKKEKSVIVWQQDNKVSRNEQNDEIIFLINDWVKNS